MVGQKWLIRWLYLSLWARLFSLVCSSSLLGLALWLNGLRPVQIQAGAIASQYQQQQDRYQTTLAALLQQPPLQRIEADITRLQQALRSEKRQIFSLPGFIAETGGQLEVWQPVANGGELTMRLRWQGVQAVFQYVSQLQPGIELPQFTLNVAEGQLYFKFVLVLNHAI